jgi:PKD repeat protein
MVTVLLGGSSAVGVVSPGHVTFTAAGDYSANPNTTGEVLKAVAAAKPDAHFALGDLSYGVAGQEQAWCDFVTARVGVGAPFELISGNHESDGSNGNINDFSACLPNQLPGVVGTYGRQYYVDVPQAQPLVRFIMISPNLTFPDGTWSYAAGTPRYSWTSARIDDARQAGIPWVVVGMHKPCLTSGEHGCEPGPDVMNLLIQKRVDLALMGHDHLYQRTKQLRLGAGCPAVQPNTYNPGCVADSDDDLTAGAGTVFLTLGTGGIPLRDYDTADPEAGYFRATSAANANGTYGVGSFDASATQLTMSFVGATGGTFSDRFTLTKRADTPNQPPTAAFTQSIDGLKVSFDSSSSKDPDGTITAYQWDFGDGSSGSTASPQHTYAQAGDYDVNLTVTDNGGATASTTQRVSVTATPGPSVLAADTFDRTVTSGWGAASPGGSWSVRGWPATSFSVGGSAGRMATLSGQSLYADLQAVKSQRSRVTGEFSVDKLADGMYVALVGRQVGSDSYVARVVVSANGQARLYLLQNFNPLASALLVPNVTIAPDVKYRLSIETAGVNPTRVSAKLWKATDAEPGWQRTATNSLASLQAPGQVGLFDYLPSSASGSSPVTLSWHDFQAVDAAP